MKKFISKILACFLFQPCTAAENPTIVDGTQDFNDEYIEIKFDASTIMIEFILTNKSDKEIILDWDNVRFIGLSGRSTRVMHSGVKYSQRFDTQTATSIAPHTSINDIMEPSSGMFFVYREEVEKPTKEKVKLQMPMIIDGKRKEYIFTFDPKELYMKDKEIIEKAKEDCLY